MSDVSNDAMMAERLWVRKGDLSSHGNNSIWARMISLLAICPTLINTTLRMVMLMPVQRANRPYFLMMSVKACNVLR